MLLAVTELLHRDIVEATTCTGSYRNRWGCALHNESCVLTAHCGYFNRGQVVLIRGIQIDGFHLQVLPAFHRQPEMTLLVRARAPQSTWASGPTYTGTAFPHQGTTPLASAYLLITAAAAAAGGAAGGYAMEEPDGACSPHNTAVWGDAPVTVVQVCEH